jgi:hypothetical protein
MTEVWKPIPSAPGYEASNMGRVRSLDRVVPVAATNSDIMQRSAHTKRRKGRVLSFAINRYVNARVAGRTRLVHRLVAEAFIGPCPEGHIVCHGPGGALDNRLENISYGTHSKNCGEDKRRDGTVSRGERNGSSRLIEAQVIEVKRRTLAGESRASISRSFGVTPEAISNIATGHTWGWLEVTA